MKDKVPLTVIKIGGNIIDNSSHLNQFISDFSKIDGYKIVVHGGGKLATKMAESIGLKTQLIDGRRITDSPMLSVTVMTYAGEINKNIVAKLQAHNCNAIGFSGADGNLIQSQKRNHPTIDYGFVGDVKTVNSKLLFSLISLGITPIFSAITHDKKGQLLNTNADTIASEIAISMSTIFEVSLIYCFEKQGVLADSEDENSVIKNINENDYADLLKNKAIHSGMIPKMDNCFYALKKGVNKVIVGNPSVVSNKNGIFTTIKL